MTTAPAPLYSIDQRVDVLGTDWKGKIVSLRQVNILTLYTVALDNGWCLELGENSLQPEAPAQGDVS